MKAIRNATGLSPQFAWPKDGDKPAAYKNKGGKETNHISHTQSRDTRICRWQCAQWKESQLSSGEGDPTVRFNASFNVEAAKAGSGHPTPALHFPSMPAARVVFELC